jgi:WhiB family redox-sensing transcriptional regulator
VNVIMDTLTLVETVGGEPLRSPRFFEGGLVLVEGQGDAEEQEWQERALCAQTDPDAFFPDKRGPTRAAKRL